MNTKLGDSKETGTQVFAILFAVAFAALLASGCSTPVVSGDSVHNTDTSDAYTNCRQVMSSYGQSTYQCDSVMSSNYGTYSYNQYSLPSTPTYTVPTTPTYYGKDSSQPTNDQLVQGYQQYLATLSPEALAEMNAQWNALAAQAH